MFVFRSCSFSMRNDVPTLKRHQKCTARREQNPMNTRQFRIGRLANLGQVIKALGKTIRRGPAPMKPSASRIERMLAKVEARLVPPPRKYLSAIIDDIDDEATVKRKKEKALAEHVARHPEDVGRTVEDFNWILAEIVRSWQGPPA
jgi:hypothetical protein